MFSSALKSFSSNITANYTIAPQPTTVAGPWRVFDAKKKSGGKAVSVFVFDRKALQAPSSSGLASSRSGGSGLGRAHDEVVERLKKEASSLARLRHPSILELAEPVEDTRNGGLMFATEPVTASLTGLLDGKDQEESSSGVGGRRSRYVVEDPESGGRKRREVEIDELEIQKGLLQIGKGLEFLHESANLVHCNLTPAAIFINAKSDWKLSGLGFCSPSEASNNTSVAPIALSEVLNYDPRLPKTVQLDFDYTSPDFIVDNNVNVGADIFSLGLVIIALYNSPHRSPLDSGSSVTQYKRIFASSATIPTQANNYLSKNPIPKDVANSLLPRMITRRPGQRFSARELQQSAYFDNILVSTIRFLDSLPAKTPNEKSQFMRGLPRILNQFPKSVLEKKVLPALLEEMKDPDLLSLVLANAFKVVAMAANSRRAFSEQVVPRLRQVFLTTTGHGKNAQLDRDTSKETGLVVLFDNMSIAANYCSGKEFKDDILPIIVFGLESPTHSVSDKALSTLSIVLPVLDFSTIKNELFPIVAQVFSKTSSLAIKVRGLEALKILCGGLEGSKSKSNGLADVQTSKANTSAVLDKYTIQEKVVPLVKGIKTKEPTVMMAALEVLRQVGKTADVEFLATDVLPCLWQFSLGPLLNLQQFQAFMELNKSLASKIEQEHSRKLRDLSSGGRSSMAGTSTFNTNGGEEQDFESLVTGRKSGADAEADAWGSWDIDDTPGQLQQQAAFSWSTPAAKSKPATSRGNMLKPQQAGSRAITPDNSLEAYSSLAPAKSTNMASFGQTAKAPQATSNPILAQQGRPSHQASSASFDWSAIDSSSGNPWSGNNGVLQPTPAPNRGPGGINVSNSGLGASTGGLHNSFSKFSIAPPPNANQQNPWANGNSNQAPGGGSLDNYDSLL